MIKIKNGKAIVYWTQKQLDFIEALRSRQYQFMLFGGGMGSGKTQLLARIFISQADAKPNTRYFVFRKNSSVLRRTTYQTFKSVAEEFGTKFKENKSLMVWEFPNGSQIWFQELDGSKDSDWDKIKGIEATAVGIDEANEVPEEAFNILMGRIWRCNPNGEHSFIILTCNPAQNWVKSRFYDPWREDTMQDKFYFQQALAKDNPFLPAEYTETLELLPEAEYQRYVMGNWDFADDPNQLIKYEWIKENFWTPEGNPQGLGIDVAREGDDRTVFAYASNKGLHNYESFKNKQTTTTSQLAIERMKEKNIGANNTAVDVVGVGGGVVDEIRSAGYFVSDYNSGHTPTKTAGHLHFKNMRAETYWDLREAFINKTWKIPNDKELVKELLAIRYKVTDKVIQIAAKAELKKELGASPDIADAVVIAKYALRGKKTLPIGII